jgi:transcriptional regulator with XRE-family HTH domain
VDQPKLAQLGTAIRNVRTRRALSIEALAFEAGLHTTSISRIENGNQNPTWESLASIAAALDVQMLEVVRLATEAPGADS